MFLNCRLCNIFVKSWLWDCDKYIWADKANLEYQLNTFNQIDYQMIWKKHGI